MQNNKRKYPIFTYVCLLLCVFTLGTGVTFARYATSQTGGGSAGIAYFVSDFSVQSVSATTFVNTDFWSGSGDDKEALNTPQSIQFVASNHKDGKVSQVDLQSSFRFTASQQFLQNCAFQLVSRDGGEHGVTPQYLMAEILSVAEGLGNGTTTLNTANFVDYGEIAGCKEQTLTISKMSANNVEHIRCVATLEDGNTVTVDISYQQDGAQNDISYGYSRGQYYSILSDNYYYNDLVGSILYATVTQKEKIYTVEITIPELFLPANKATSVELFFYLTTTEKQTVENYQYPDKFFDTVNTDGTLKNIYYDVPGVTATANDGSSMTIPVRLTTTADSMKYTITANDGSSPTFNFETTNPTYTYQAIVGTKLYDIANITTSGNTTSGTFAYGGNTYTVNISTQHTHPLYNAKSGSQNLILGELMNTVYNFNAQVLFVQASELGISSGGANE